MHTTYTCTHTHTHTHSLAITQTYFLQHRMYCITSTHAGDAIHPVLREVGLADSETNTHTHTKANQHHQYKLSSPNVNSHPMVILASSPGPFSAFVWQYYTCITPYRAAVLYIQVYIQFLETIELL